MREILFKGKRIDNGEWVEGYYIYHIKRTLYPCGDKLSPEDEQHAIMCDGFSDWGMPRDTVHYDIDPDTLCQYTGLTDKNGNKIFENDIVKCCSVDITEKYLEFVSEVFFRDGTWLVREPDDCEDLLYGYDDSLKWVSHVPEIEVIGNVFDNPELLESEE